MLYKSFNWQLKNINFISILHILLYNFDINLMDIHKHIHIHILIEFKQLFKYPYKT